MPTKHEFGACAFLLGPVETTSLDLPAALRVQWQYHCDLREAAMPIRSLRTMLEGQEPIMVPKSATVLDGARLMKQHNVGALLVMDGSRLSGIFTERDALFRVVAAARDPVLTPLAEVMTPQPQTIHPDEPFLQALRIMHKGRFRHLPVVEFDRPLGMVSVRDALDDDLYELRTALQQREDMLE
jgi:CBS domain-containing protein